MICAGVSMADQPTPTVGRLVLPAHADHPLVRKVLLDDDRLVRTVVVGECLDDPGRPCDLALGGVGPHRVGVSGLPSVGPLAAVGISPDCTRCDDRDHEGLDCRTTLGEHLDGSRTPDGDGTIDITDSPRQWRVGISTLDRSRQRLAP